MKLHTLTKVRRTTKQADGAEGILYIHQWPDGFQEMIFATEVLSQQFLDKLNAAFGSKAGGSLPGATAQEPGNAQPA